MDGCEKWVATRNKWQVCMSQRSMLLVTFKVKGTEVACCIVICHDYNVAARHIGVTAQYASVEKGHY